MSDEDATITRRCHVCKITKPLIDLKTDRANKLGKSYICKPCEAARSRAYRSSHAEARRLYRSAYYRANREACLAASRASRLAKIEAYRAHQAAYAKSHPRTRCQAHRDRAAEYRKLHPEEARAYRKSEVGKAAWEKYKSKFPERFKARYALSDAIKAGKIEPAETCSQCRKQRKTEGHHHKGYAPEHWLDVEWLCKDCHGIADRKFL